MNEHKASAVSIALQLLGIAADVQRIDGALHCLISPERGADFRRAVHSAGWDIVMEYHQDGHASGLSDWRSIKEKQA